MNPTYPDLLASSHPIIELLLTAAIAAYGLAAVVALVRPQIGGWLAGVGVAVHLAGMIGRGWVIGYLPLTNKFESFSTASLAVAIVAVVSWKPVRLYGVSLMLIASAYMAAALAFPHDMAYPPPLMRTIWYPLHVPLSFMSYGLWVAAGAASLVWIRNRDPMWLARIDKMALQGFGIWTVSMFFGGWWGVVAWGAYFLWDPKVLWSVILWFHYAAFIHVRLTPSLMQRAWVRPALALLGVAWVFVAYVGTSFFFGKGSHAW